MISKARESDGTQDKTLLMHFLELRKMMIAALIVWFVGFILSYSFVSVAVLDAVKAPIEERGVTVIYTNLSEALATRIRISMVLGAVITSPVLFFLIWRFIKPALYPDEIKRFRILFVICLFLFAAGVLFCAKAVFGLAVDFFLAAGESVALPMLTMDRYVSFIISFILPFGLAFELPVIIYMLVRHGVISYSSLTSVRKYVIFFTAVVSALLTPPDVISQLMLALPLYLLYEAGVLVARFTQ